MIWFSRLFNKPLKDPFSYLGDEQQAHLLVTTLLTYWLKLPKGVIHTWQKAVQKTLAF